MITRPDMRRLLAWMTTFFIAMAFLESAVVVYLRALFYPQEFEFPIVPMHGILVTTEVFREFATLIMLLAPGALVTRSALERFARFCFGFGVWDIFYYVLLRILIGWPASLYTEWDLLFLVPLPWVGPVWAPILIGATRARLRPRTPSGSSPNVPPPLFPRTRIRSGSTKTGHWLKTSPLFSASPFAATTPRSLPQKLQDAERPPHTPTKTVGMSG